MNLLLGEAVAQFIARYDNPLSARAYRQVLDGVLAVISPDTPLQDVTREDLDRWDQKLRARSLADATIATRRCKVRAFFNWCQSRGYIEEHVASHLRVRRPRVSMASKAIPSGVLTAMMAAVRQRREPAIALRDAAILALMVTFGVRRGDIARLTLRRVSLREDWIVFRVKGDNEVRLPLPPETAGILAAWLELRTRLTPDTPHTYVFTAVREDEHDRYRPLSPDAIAAMIRRLSEEVCGTAYGPHSIRHWFGQQQADRRIPPTLLRDIMGHSDVKITLDFYYNQDFERARRVLVETELAKALRPAPETPATPKILKVDFSA